ncbi:COG4711 Predicted membrane protein [Fimbriimonadaceae bacterium]
MRWPSFRRFSLPKRRLSQTIVIAAGTYAQGVAGGLMFGLPLLFTMEMWQHGATIPSAHLLLSIALTFGILLLFNRTVGTHPDASFRDVVMESVEELGLGFIVAATVLHLIGRIHVNMPFAELAGKVTMEALVTSIGVSIGTVQFGASANGASTNGKREVPILGQIAVAFCGAIFVAASVAPTEEVLLIAVESSPVKAFRMLIACLILTALILGFTDLRRSRDFRTQCWIPRSIFGPVVTVGVALTTATILLWFFRHLDDRSFAVNLRQIVTLAVPGALGASAGRILFKA